MAFPDYGKASARINSFPSAWGPKIGSLWNVAFLGPSFGAERCGVSSNTNRFSSDRRSKLAHTYGDPTLPSYHSDLLRICPISLCHRTPLCLACMERFGIHFRQVFRDPRETVQMIILWG